MAHKPSDQEKKIIQDSIQDIRAALNCSSRQGHNGLCSMCFNQLKTATRAFLSASKNIDGELKLQEPQNDN